MSNQKYTDKISLWSKDLKNNPIKNFIKHFKEFLPLLKKMLSKYKMLTFQQEKDVTVVRIYTQMFVFIKLTNSDCL